MLIALLAWFDEQPKQLAACVASLAKAGVGHVVAVDGAYALYPGGQRHSDGRQHLAIQYACGELGIGLTLHAPPRTWEGNEVEKRTFLFALGLTVATDGDWFLVIDADEAVIDAPEDLSARLERTVEEVGQVTMRDIQPGDKDWYDADIARLFRAQPIRVEGNHWTYRNGQGKVVCGRPEDMEVPVADFTDLRLQHRRGYRVPERQLTQGHYYEAVNDRALERRECRCGRPGRKAVPTNWRVTGQGAVADLADMCGLCAQKQDYRNRRRLRDLGLPEDLKYNHRMGNAPKEAAA